MSGIEETFLDPAATATGAMALTSTGESLSSRFTQLSAKIETLHGAAPWGHDDPGKSFNKDYLDGEAPAKLTLEGSKNLVERVRQLGPDVRSAVEGTVEMDDLVGKWFGGDEK